MRFTPLKASVKVTLHIRSHLCGFDINLTYPQNGNFPTLDPPYPGDDDSSFMKKKSKNELFKQLLKQDIKDRRRGVVRRTTPTDEMQYERREQWKRDLTGRPNGTLDQWYLCDLFDEMVDYAVNFTFPWSECHFGVCAQLLN